MQPYSLLAMRAARGRELALVERHEHQVWRRRGRLADVAAGRGDGALATASGLRAGIPSPWRWKALRSDGQVVPSSAAAALTLPSRSANWKARTASPRSARKRLGCQPRGWRRPRSAFGSERLLSEVDRRTVRHHRADAASAGSRNLEGAPSRAARGPGAWCPIYQHQERASGQLGANAHGQVLEAGQVPGCHLGLLAPADHSEQTAGCCAMASDAAAPSSASTSHPATTTPIP
jgi:hypothetical protein